MNWKMKMNNEEKIKALVEELQSLLNEKDSVDISMNIKLEVKCHDEPETMTWHEAMAKFGPEGTDKEWRLPTWMEFFVVYENKYKIHNMTDGYYWSSSENSTNFAWIQRFSDGYQANANKNNSYYVRCVRR